MDNILLQKLKEDLDHLTDRINRHQHKSIDGTTPLDSNDSGIAGRSSGSGVTAIPDNVFTKVTPTNNFVNGVTWNSASSRFLITSAGRYQINAQVMWSSGSGTALTTTAIYKNGVIASYSNGLGALNITIGVHDILDLSINDYIELYVYQNSGSSKNIYGVSGVTFISLAKV